MRVFLSVVCVLTSFFAQADLVIKDATVRLLPPGVPNTAVYFSVTNTGDQSRFLTAAESAIAEKVELHNHVMRGEVMKMEQQAFVEVGAGQTIEFKPGGLHLMVFGLNTPLVENKQVKVAVVTRNGEKIAFNATAQKPGGQMHHHH